MFQIQCKTKGCMKITEAYLNTSDNEVYCAECNSVIQDVPVFTKKSMASIGQKKKQEKQAFSVKCEKCKNDTLPKVVNNNLCCTKCSAQLNVSATFKPLILKAIKDAGQV